MILRQSSVQAILECSMKGQLLGTFLWSERLVMVESDMLCSILDWFNAGVSWIWTLADTRNANIQVDIPSGESFS